MDQETMKKTALAVALGLTLAITGCSSFTSSKSAGGVDPGEVRPLKDTRLSTDFEREGIRVTYTFFGEVEKIEAFGYADVWRANFRHVAEADAKDKLVKFLRGETVSTTRMTRVIAKSIERSQDNTFNRFKTVDGTLNFSETDLEKEDGAAGNVEENSRKNTALRKDSVNNAMIVASTITVTAKGRLSAVYKHSGNVVDDGKTYRAVYVWTPKEQKAARSVTNQMDAK
jgi:hypothetical protein